MASRKIPQVISRKSEHYLQVFENGEWRSWAKGDGDTCKKELVRQRGMSPKRRFRVVLRSVTDIDLRW